MRSCGPPWHACPKQHAPRTQLLGRTCRHAPRLLKCCRRRGHSLAGILSAPIKSFEHGAARCTPRAALQPLQQGPAGGAAHAAVAEPTTCAGSQATGSSCRACTSDVRLGGQMVMLQQRAVHRVHHAVLQRSALRSKQTLHAAECMVQTPVPGARNRVGHTDTEECNFATLMQHLLTHVQQSKHASCMTLHDAHSNVGRPFALRLVRQLGDIRYHDVVHSVTSATRGNAWHALQDTRHCSAFPLCSVPSFGGSSPCRLDQHQLR